MDSGDNCSAVAVICVVFCNRQEVDAQLSFNKTMLFRDALHKLLVEHKREVTWHHTKIEQSTQGFSKHQRPIPADAGKPASRWDA